MIWQKINYIHNNPVKARMVRSAADYRWSSFRAFYQLSDEPVPVDREWWWPDDVKRLSVAMGEERQRFEERNKAIARKRPPGGAGINLSSRPVIVLELRGQTQFQGQ
jgi:hypothetical protein